MSDFHDRSLPEDRDVVAPDGSDVRLLVEVEAGGLAHFQLAPGATAIGIYHRTVDELWYFVGGAGEMWRRRGDSERVIHVEPGTAVSIPRGTHFQFRCTGSEPLEAVGATMPKWPGDGEAVRSDLAPWVPTVEAGPGLAAG